MMRFIFRCYGLIRIFRHVCSLKSGIEGVSLVVVVERFLQKDNGSDSIILDNTKVSAFVVSVLALSFISSEPKI